MRGLAAILVALAIWTAGLLAFADRVARSTPAEEPAPAQGIVALTGASDLRLEAATRLLENGKGERLLLSGVSRKATRKDMLGVTGAAKPIFDCCVDLGFTAADTIGNGSESAEWARGMGFTRLILVTADFHMPRAMLELKSAMPEAQITAYPVATPAYDAAHWAGSTEGARRIALEYCKYLVILMREAVLSVGEGPRHPPATTPAS
ncbi:MAG: YdcF family protein [Proteobacteria bacterium]|nr:YdcF family protein [Pseudomonadota bacterium]